MTFDNLVFALIGEDSGAGYPLRDSPAAQVDIPRNRILTLRLDLVTVLGQEPQQLHSRTENGKQGIYRCFHPDSSMPTGRIQSC